MFCLSHLPKEKQIISFLKKNFCFVAISFKALASEVQNFKTFHFFSIYMVVLKVLESNPE